MKHANDCGFHAYKYGYIHQAIDFADLQAFARRLGVTQ